MENSIDELHKKKYSNFRNDLDWANRPEILENKKKAMYKIFGDDVIIESHEEIMAIQKNIGSDFKIIRKGGRGMSYTIDIKTRKYNWYMHDSYPIELSHNIYEDKERIKFIQQQSGWLYKNNVNLILFLTYNEEETDFVEACCFDLQALQTSDSITRINKERISAGTYSQDYRYWQTINAVLPIRIIEEICKARGNFFKYIKLDGAQ